MNVVSLELSGFRDFDDHVKLNFIDAQDHYIFDTVGNRKSVLLNIILGIIFGFSETEEQKYRSADKQINTCTGNITIALDDRSLIFERDIETGIVACMLVTSDSTKTLYIGKDSSEDNRRPFLNVLKSIFPIVDKKVILDSCNQLFDYPESSFLDILNTLSLFLVPFFKTAEIKKQLLDSKRLMRTHKSGDKKNRKKNDLLSQLENNQTLLAQALAIENMMSSIKTDVNRFRFLTENINDKESAISGLTPDEDNTTPGEDFVKFRADIILWRSLRDIMCKNQKELNIVKNKYQELCHVLNTRFKRFKQLPENFAESIRQYNTLNKYIERLKTENQESDDRIANIEKQLEKTKKIAIYTSVFFSIVSFILTRISGIGFWVWLVLNTILLAVSLTVFYKYKFINKKRAVARYYEEVDTNRKYIKSYRKKLKQLVKARPLLNDIELCKYYQNNVTAYQKLVNDLRVLKEREDELTEILNSEILNNQYKTYQKRYGRLIDIDRPDLEQHLNYLVQKKKDKVPPVNKDFSGKQEILNVIDTYQNLSFLLNNTKIKIMKRLNLDSEKPDLNKELEVISRQIINLKLRDEMPV